MISLSDEQRLLVNTLSDLAESEFGDQDIDGDADRMMDNVKTLAEAGFVGVNFPEKYGGGGMSEIDALLTIEAVGRVDPDVSGYLATQQFTGPRAIEMFGSDAVKEDYLPRVTAGETGIAIAISEPNAGSDIRSMNTRVIEENGQYILNGEKILVSRVPYSDAAVVWAKFEDGFGTVVIDFDWAGVEIQQHFTNMAGHKQTQFYMEDVEVPEEYVITHGSDGFKNQLKALNWERLGAAVGTNTIARCAADKALEYAHDREQFDQPIGDFQGIEWKIADMLKELEPSRALSYMAADKAHREDSSPDRMFASIAKLYSAEMAESVVSEALQIFGANGYQQGHDLEYLYRLARGYRIAGGTDEVVKNQIAAAAKRDGLLSLT